MAQDGEQGRHPLSRRSRPHTNFIGAERCARQIEEIDVWKRARAIKANPDSPQRAIRHLALKQGKTVYMAVPKLRELECFVELDPEKLGDKIYKASSIKDAFEHGKQVTLTTGSTSTRRSLQVYLLFLILDLSTDINNNLALQRRPDTTLN